MLELLRPSQIARRVSQAAGCTFTAGDVFRAVNEGAVEPHAIAGALPLFRSDQIDEMSRALAQGVKGAER